MFIPRKKASDHLMYVMLQILSGLVMVGFLELRV